ncbi:hypothetical protein KK141_18350 [Dyella sp. LX-66]|uniref:hypothetical protein n=1 Tax=unclassified Dyella TaxID=2634549 RepID=UPI001BE0DE9F|nr:MULTISPECIES: hypothetical protein [unclassified Dyella]MBT2119143.1 hypothetical protein [Dyella sp. LX-1]MBT2141514.1 hypothetical protein [Dyella sp. LX-66]
MQHAASRTPAAGRFMLFAAIGMLGASPLLAASGQPQDHVKEKHAMTTAATGSSSGLSASQALQRTLELIRASKSVADITPESMQGAFGVEVKKVDPQQFGYGQRLPGNWAFSIMRQEVSGAGRVDLNFNPLPGTQAALEDICDPDFARFTAELESMGFARHSAHGEHNRWTYDAFERPGMRVEVYPEVAHADNGEPTGPICVKMVQVR